MSRSSTWPLVALAFGVIGVLLFAGSYLGYIPSRQGTTTAPAPSFYRLTAIGVYFQYVGTPALFGPNVSQACSQCPISLQAGSSAQLYYSSFNTSGAAKTVWVNLTLTSGNQVFATPDGPNATSTRGIIIPVDRLIPIGLDLVLPVGGSGDFAVIAYIQVEY
jgi:hypothetical protein